MIFKKNSVLYWIRLKIKEYVIIQSPGFHSGHLQPNDTVLFQDSSTEQLWGLFISKSKD